MTFAAPHAYDASWLPEAEAMTSVPSRGDGVDAAEGVVRLAADRLHLLRLAPEVQREHLLARRFVRPAVVDGVGDAGLLERHRGVCHHRGTPGNARQNSGTRRI
jgi:hypothetical protein